MGVSLIDYYNDVFFSNETRPASLVWSGQVSSLGSVVSQPINLTFRVDIPDNGSQSYRCVFWNGT